MLLVLRSACTALLCAAAPFTLADVSRYDLASGVLTIPTVGVGSTVYAGVTLKNRGNFVFDIQGAGMLPLGGPVVGTFDTASGVLALPAVQVGSATFVDVTLRDTGGLVFALQSGTELPAATRAEIDALMRANEQLFATAVPADGAARLALVDSCHLQNGRTKAYEIADIDADLPAYRAREAYQIGRRVTNLQVLALRNTTNADGSARREIDVEYDLEFTDGTADRKTFTTLISGSSAGNCATPQNGTALRFSGNRKVVDTGVFARNLRDERYARSTGAALSPAVYHRRSIEFRVADAMGNATHAIVTGPGPAGNVGGSAVQFSLKLVSPRVMRDAPEFAGKNNNYLNWPNDDAFRMCRIAGSNVPVAAIADCAGLGAGGFDWGWGPTSAPNAAADQSFADQGWIAGGIYRIDVYNDDGWKTVNGQAGRTPIATYWATLETLPYTFVQMTTGAAGGELLPRLNFGARTTAQVAANANSATPVPIGVTWSALPGLPDGRRFGLFQGYEYHDGARTGNANGAFFPAYRTLTRNYPGSTATAQPAWTTTPMQPGQASKNYFDYTLFYVDRNGARLISTASFR
jgi:hypothetical protein